jgi:ZIP family zinc transporter
VLEVFLAASATTLATGLGAIPVALLGVRVAEYRSLMLGVAGGVMTVAAVAGLMLPAIDEGGSTAEIAGGLIAGLGFLLLAQRVVRERSAAKLSVSARTSLLVFAVLLVHSLPEGFAIGTAFASATSGLGLFVVIAIGIQNVPEGTSVALPMAAAGISSARQFWAAVLTSVPQPVGAVVAYVLVEEVTALLPVSFSFAAGAMLALVAFEIIPSAVRAVGVAPPAGGVRGPAAQTAIGALAGGAVMVALSWALGV